MCTKALAMCFAWRTCSVTLPHPHPLLDQAYANIKAGAEVHLSCHYTIQLDALAQDPMVSTRHFALCYQVFTHHFALCYQSFVTF